MQTLNVGAGRSDDEYQADQERHRAELRDDIRFAANLFFIAAVLATLNSSLGFIRFNFAVSIGLFELLAWYGKGLGSQQFLVTILANVAFIATLVALGFAARQGKRWPFLLGLVLYGLDAIALTVVLSLLAVGVHGFFVFKWFQAQRAVKDLAETTGDAAAAGA